MKDPILSRFLNPILGSSYSASPLQVQTTPGCSVPNIKSYVLSAHEGTEMRVILIKKNGTNAASVTVSLPGR